MENETEQNKESRFRKIIPYIFFFLLGALVMTVLIVHVPSMNRTVCHDEIQSLMNINTELETRLAEIENRYFSIQNYNGEYFIIFQKEILKNASGDGTMLLDMEKLKKNPYVRLASWVDGSDDIRFFQISGQSEKNFLFTIPEECLRNNLVLQIMRSDGTWDPLRKDEGEKKSNIPNMRKSNSTADKKTLIV